MIPENHICFFVEEFVDSLDFSKFDMINEGAGHPSYHPRILVKILLQGMLSKERSSRKIACACRESFIFMYLAEKVCPDFRTICRFRRQNASFVKEVFKETIKLAGEYNLLDLSFIAIDGTTLKANANKKRTIKKEQFENLDFVIDKLVEGDLKQDELDEKLDEENLTHMDKRDFKKIVFEYKRVKDKDKLKNIVDKAKKEVLKDDKIKKVSLTDPESRMMQNKQRVRELSYNSQFSVDKNQMILAIDVCQEGHDVKQLIPQIENVKENVDLKDSAVSADCGYSDGDNIKYCEDNGIDLYVPSRAQAQKFDGKEQSLNHDKYEYDGEKEELTFEGEAYQKRNSYIHKNGRRVVTFYSSKLKKKKEVPFFFQERLRMRDKMSTEKGKKIYSLRKITVEPVIGQVKENFGFRQFSLRGVEGANIELNLVGTVHNLKKIFKHRRKKKNYGEVLKERKWVGNRLKNIIEKDEIGEEGCCEDFDLEVFVRIEVLIYWNCETGSHVSFPTTERRRA